MASIIAKLWMRLCAKKASLSIMIIGLDNSGKTSVLNHLASLNRHHHHHHQRQQHTQKSQDCDMISNEQVSAFNQVELNQPATKIANQSRDDRSHSPSSLKPTSTNINLNKTFTASGGSMMPTVGYNYERILYRNVGLTVLDFSGQNRYRNLWQEFYNGVDGIVFVVDSSDLLRLVVVRDELETMLSHPYFSTLMGSREQQSSGGGVVGTAIANTLSSSSSRFSWQKQFTISQGKLIESPLDTAPIEGGIKFTSSGGALGALATQQKNSNSDKNSLQSSTTTTTTTRRRRTKVPILFLANKSDLANSLDTEVIVKALNLNQLLALDRHPWLIQATSVNLSQGIVEGFDWLVGQMSVEGGY